MNIPVPQLPNKQRFTIPEVRQIFAEAGFEISRQTLYRWAEEGKLEKSTIGRNTWVTRDSIILIISMSTDGNR